MDVILWLLQYTQLCLCFKLYWLIWWQCMSMSTYIMWSHITELVIKRTMWANDNGKWKKNATNGRSRFVSFLILLIRNISFDEFEELENWCLKVFRFIEIECKRKVSLENSVNKHKLKEVAQWFIAFQRDRWGKKISNFFRMLWMLNDNSH